MSEDTDLYSALTTQTASLSSVLGDIEVVAYWTNEETPQLHSIEINQTIDTDEEYTENSVTIKSEELYVFEKIVSEFADDKRMQEFLKDDKQEKKTI